MWPASPVSGSEAVDSIVDAVFTGVSCSLVFLNFSRVNLSSFCSKISVDFIFKYSIYAFEDKLYLEITFMANCNERESIDSFSASASFSWLSSLDLFMRSSFISLGTFDGRRSTVAGVNLDVEEELELEEEEDREAASPEPVPNSPSAAAAAAGGGRGGEESVSLLQGALEDALALGSLFVINFSSSHSITLSRPERQRRSRLIFSISSQCEDSLSFSITVRPDSLREDMKESAMDSLRAHFI